MSKKHVFALIFNMFCFAAIAAGQNYVFRHIDLTDGLPDNQIRNLSIAPDGRLGIKTASIFTIYNGASFDNFYQDTRKTYQWNHFRHPAVCYDHKGRAWVKEQTYLLLLDLNTNRFVYDIDGELQSFGVGNRLTELFIDDAKNFWFVTEDSTLSLYNIKDKTLKIIVEGGGAFARKYGLLRELRQYKTQVWMVFSGGLIACWDYAKSGFVAQDTHFLNTITPNTDRVFLCPTAAGDLWLMYNEAISFYSRTERRWTQVADISGASNFFVCMDLDKDGNLWAGTSWSGLRFIDGKTFKVQVLNGVPLDNGVLHSDIHSIVVDESGGVWVGTMFQGFCYYHPSMRKFQLYQTVAAAGGVSNEFVRCFLEEDDGNVLVGTANGLFRFHPDTHQIEKLFRGKIEGLCLSLYRDRQGKVWVGSFLDGFYCIDGKTLKHCKVTNRLNQNVGRAIYQDESGQYWVSINYDGIGRLNPATGKVSLLADKFPKLKSHKVNYNFFPAGENRFAVTGEAGIFYYDTQADSVYLPEIDTPSSPKFTDVNTKYYCVLKDRRGLEWFCTERGIRIWDDEQRKLYTMTMNEGLPNNIVTAILEDSASIIWISTVSSISKIEVARQAGEYRFSVVNFSTPDGLQTGKFYENSALKARNGDFYFGGIHGFNVFNPQRMVYNKKAAKPVFTAFKLFNSEIRENTAYKGRVVLQQPINRTQELRLRYNENYITLEFSGLNYVNPRQTFFRYRLENFDKNWTEISTGGQGSATYTGLAAGTYLFRVQSANNDKIWSDDFALLKIVISPPLWATGYAYALYVLLCACAVYYFIRRYVKKKLLLVEKQRQQDAERQKEELDQLKFRFFTNISHEFRTPLTLILSPLEALMKTADNDTLREKLTKIHKNAKDLLNLVNQLLDFRKLEMKGESLQLDYGDLVAFTDVIFHSFEEIAESRAIAFSERVSETDLYMFFDKNKVQKILNNLLSNAFKYTAAGGQIVLSLYKTAADGREYAVIRVSDTGAGIPADKVPLIFERFYQLDNAKGNTGSGIGLHLVKEYIALHEGSINVKSKEGVGSEFEVRLPADLGETADIAPQPAEKESEPVEKTPPTTPAESEMSQKFKILVVEDNPDFRQFLADELKESYEIVQAADGEEGEQQALKELPDLIISDLMMPRMDGVELCAHIKKNIQTSHIPVILLTARASDETRLTGYEAGADDYISKPFNLDVLLLRIRRLIAQQQERQAHFRNTIDLNPAAITITPLDETLLKRAIESVEKNMSNVDYSADMLGADLNMSRSTLYRKIQSLTGLSPHEFITSIKMKRCADLLLHSDLRIVEIADLSGYDSINKTFYKAFKREFGVSPKEFREQGKTG